MEVGVESDRCTCGRRELRGFVLKKEARAAAEKMAGERQGLTVRVLSSLRVDNNIPGHW